MAHYLGQLYWEIELVANSPELAPFLTGNEASLAQLEQKFSGAVLTLKTEDMTHISI